MVEIKNVSKVFTNRKGDITACSDVTFTFNEGEVFGLIGTNGAGKTTLMRMIATMLKPTSGTITVKGTNTANAPEKTRELIGILFGGDAALYDRLTARENIEYFASLSGMTKAQAQMRIKELSDFFAMNDYLDRPAAKFSKGMKQKVCFARAIVHNPPVMLFDETTSGLDIIAAEEVISFIKECRTQKKAVLLSSHDMSEVEELCDRVAIIDKGVIKDIGTIKELTDKYQKKNIKQVFFHLTEAKNEE